MNTKKIAGLLCWLVAFLLPFQPGLLSTESVGNIHGLIGFVGFVVLLFTGYWLVDSSNSTKSESHGH